MLKTITDEQKSIYDHIGAMNNNNGGMFFVYGFGGTGKTFLWSILGAALRSEGMIVLNVASSGIASLLLQGGRTAHSQFGIPIAVDSTTMCSINSNSPQAALIREAKLIIWDEAPMMRKYCIETLDRSMRDILKNDDVFGGKVIVFGGDFRQILPVIVGGNSTQTLLATINSSTLWDNCTVLELTKNMRFQNGAGGDRVNELEAFSKWILDVGDGKIISTDNDEAKIEIPDDLLIK
ncbi:uncharacterized protein LOC112087501 [Eutrema salsugineum]|uniref:uncharacterized protein LOC112087501 n=1 Tax=Eutrema salsugineum TaxID=72664 RepID=UPI000CED6BB7|nr:uncharacterized protein LOC112087501 [Eutrema salsugineum]